MKIFLDTSAVNWLTEESNHATALLGLHRSEQVKLVAGAEVALEARRTHNPVKRAKLEAILEELFTLLPTRLPRSGTASLGLAIAQPGAKEMWEELVGQMWEELVGLGKKINNLDPTHLLNAHFEKCDYFLHRDRLSLVKTRAGLKSRTYARLAPLEFRGEEGQTPPPCSALSSFSSLSAPVRCGRCVGAEPTS